MSVTVLTKWVALGAVFLVSAAAGGSNEYGHGRWRYSTGTFENRAIPRNYPIALEYVSNTTTGAAWNFPVRDCSLTSVTATTASLSCRTCDNHEITVTPDSNSSLMDTFYVSTCGTTCYEWYYVQLETGTETVSHPLRRDQTSCTLRIWVIDLSTASAEELAGTAATPAQVSMALTVEWAYRGEFPSVLSKYYSKHNNNITWGMATYSTNGYWEVQLSDVYSHAAQAVITGRGTVSFGCSIGERSVFIMKERFDSPGTLGYGTNLNLPSAFVTKEVTDPCSENIKAFVLSTGAILTSQSGITTTGALTTAPDGGTFVDAIFSAAGMLAVTSAGALYLYTHAGPVTTVSGLESVTMVRSSSVCDLFVSFDGSRYSRNKVVVALSSTKAHISTDGGLSFNFTSDVPSNAVVKDAFIPFEHQIVMLLVQSGALFQICFINYKWQETLYDNVTLTATTSVSANTTYGALSGGAMGSPHVFVYGDAVLMSSNGGTVWREVVLYSRDQARPAVHLGAGETIHNVFSDDSQYVIQTSDNRIFYGMLSAPGVVEMQAGETSSARVRFGFDMSHRLSAITLETENSVTRTSVRGLEVANELVAPRVPLTSAATKCPIAEFSADLPIFFVLDLNSTERVFVSYSIPFGETTGLSVTVTDPWAIQYNVVAQNVELMGNFVKETMTIEFNSGISSVNDMYAGHRVNKFGRDVARISVSLVPKAFVDTCGPELKKTAIVAMGCQAGRHLRLSLVAASSQLQSECPGLFNSTVLIDGQAEPYQASWGCPWRLYNGYEFRIVPELWDGDVKVESVPGDFIMYETNGRVSDGIVYGYSDVQAGCIRPSDSRTKKILNGSYFSPTNYESCHESGPNSSLGFNPKYEILNSTFQKLRWHDRADGFYTYRVVVVDPTYSFCDLQSTISFEVYGRTMSTELKIMILFSFIAFTILALTVSYFKYYFKLMQIKEEQEKKDQ